MKHKLAQKIRLYGKIVILFVLFSLITNGTCTRVSHGPYSSVNLLIRVNTGLSGSAVSCVQDIKYKLEPQFSGAQTFSDRKSFSINPSANQCIFDYRVTGVTPGKWKITVEGVGFGPITCEKDVTDQDKDQSIGFTAGSATCL